MAISGGQIRSSFPLRNLSIMGNIPGSNSITTPGVPVGRTDTTARILKIYQRLFPRFSENNTRSIQATSHIQASKRQRRKLKKRKKKRDEKSASENFFGSSPPLSPNASSPMNGLKSTGPNLLDPTMRSGMLTLLRSKASKALSRTETGQTRQVERVKV